VKQVGAKPELQHVCRCARTQGRFHEVGFLLDCHDNDVGVIAGAPQLPTDLNATQVAYGHTEEKNVRAQRGIIAQYSSPLPHGSNNLVLVSQHFGHKIEHRGVVITKQHAGFRHVIRCYDIRLGRFCQVRDHTLPRAAEFEPVTYLAMLAVYWQCRY